MSRSATAWRRRVVERMYRNEAKAPTLEEQDHWHLCREILRRALEGWRDPWVAAHYYLYGMHPDKLRRYLADRTAQAQWELARPKSPLHPAAKPALRRCG